jgi:hypothetical protein
MHSLFMCYERDSSALASQKTLHHVPVNPLYRYCQPSHRGLAYSHAPTNDHNVTVRLKRSVSHCLTALSLMIKVSNARVTDWHRHFSYEICCLFYEECWNLHANTI